jgi:hypothetical protein
VVTSKAEIRQVLLDYDSSQGNARKNAIFGTMTSSGASTHTLFANLQNCKIGERLWRVAECFCFEALSFFISHVHFSCSFLIILPSTLFSSLHRQLHLFFSSAVKDKKQQEADALKGLDELGSPIAMQMEMNKESSGGGSSSSGGGSGAGGGGGGKGTKKGSGGKKGPATKKGTASKGGSGTSKKK